jgi:hypothetical protein
VANPARKQFPLRQSMKYSGGGGRFTGPPVGTEPVTIVIGTMVVLGWSAVPVATMNRVPLTSRLVFVEVAAEGDTSSVKEYFTS